MLIELTIKNIALIESLRLEFSGGFNVLTGETGAGKSIIVDSINLILGGRADRDLIRTGEEKAFVQALFDVSGNTNVISQLNDMGIEPEEGLVTITRELSRSGRNICRVCGVIVQLTSLKTVASCLMEVHGQHEHQSLMDSANHLGFIDSFGNDEHKAYLRAVADAYIRRSGVRKELKELMRDAAERERLVDILKFQVNEIASAKLKEGEEEKLEVRLKVLENSEKVRTHVGEAYRLIYSGNGNAISAQEALLRASNEMAAIASLDPRYFKLSETLKGLYYSAQEVGSDLQSLEGDLNYDPSLLDKIGNRLDLISKLERKYGSTEAEVIKFGAQAAQRLNSIESGDDRIVELKKEYKALDQVLREACSDLTKSRITIAKKFEESLLKQLKDLGMGKTRFEVRFQQMEKPSENGADEVEFMISPNPGEELKPLSSTASGGELSRIMLAMRVIALNVNNIDSMVFDEIDTGVSGRMAQVVGEKMLTIGLRNQVLCVTHLPQIAALGDAQFCVAKHTDGERTITEVFPLDRNGRINEISRLVGGSSDTQSSLSHAENMLDDADNVRNRLHAELLG